MKVFDAFSGIGGASLAFERVGCEVIAHSEIEDFPSKVLHHHWPDVPNLGDIKKIDGYNFVKENSSVDVLTGGSPCQDVSVAGKRGGLAAERSGLFFEFVRLAKEMQPSYIVFENVPGLLSSNNREDIKVVLDAFVNLGYLFDIDVLDAQDFGVPQRRKRVFIVCQSASSLLNKKTFISEITIAQYLQEILQSILDVRKSPFTKGLKDLGWQSSILKTGLNRKMQQFSLQTEEGWAILHKNLVESHLHSASASKTLGLEAGKSMSATSPIGMAEKLSNTITKTECGSEKWNTALLWKNILEDSYSAVKWYTTSTETNKITESTTYTSLKALLNIGRLIYQLSNLSMNCKSVVLSVSTAIQEYMNYAREYSSESGSGTWVFYNWTDLFKQATNICTTLRRIADGGGQEILFEPEVMPRSNSKGRCKRKNNSTSITEGSNPTIKDHTLVFDWQSGGDVRPNVTEGCSTTLQTGQVPAVLLNNAVRKLTPLECERLQGFPDDWTYVPSRYLKNGEPRYSDSARYKALGNAWAVPCGEWIAKRIVAVEKGWL